MVPFLGYVIGPSAQLLAAESAENALPFWRMDGIATGAVLLAPRVNRHASYPELHPVDVADQDVVPSVSPSPELWRTGDLSQRNVLLSKKLLTDSMTACWSPLSFLPHSGHLKPERRASKARITLPQEEQYMSPFL